MSFCHETTSLPEELDENAPSEVELFVRPIVENSSNRSCGWIDAIWWSVDELIEAESQRVRNSKCYQDGRRYHSELDTREILFGDPGPLGEPALR